MKPVQLSFESIQYGYCKCGCGQKTSIAPRNRKDLGWIKGEPVDYISGHSRKSRGSPAVPFGKKWCGNCRKVKDVTEFFKNAAAFSGLQSRCKDCLRIHQREWRAKNRDRSRYYSMRFRLRTKYGVTYEFYEELLEKQNHRCAICGQSETRKSNGVPILMAVDHDHDTGKIRGVLCNNCNRALGLLKDDTDVLRKAIEYLENA